MKALIILLVMLMPHYVFAQEQAAPDETVLPSAEVESLLNLLKNPFESKLPPPPVIPDPVQASHNDPYGQNNGVNMPDLSGVPDMLEKPVEIQKPDVSLEGMVWSDKIQQVIIKGQILNVGDETNGLKLIKVSRDGAILQFKGKDFLFNIE